MDAPNNHTFLFILCKNVTFVHKPHKPTEVRFASLFSSRFITDIVVNPTERRLAKRASVHTVAMNEHLCMKNAGFHIAMDFS